MKWVLAIVGVGVIAWIMLRRRAVDTGLTDQGGLDPSGQPRPPEDPEYRAAIQALDATEIGKLTHDHKDVFGGSKFSTIPTPVTESTASIYKEGSFKPGVTTPSTGLTPGWKIIPSTGPAYQSRTGKGHF